MDVRRHSLIGDTTTPHLSEWLKYSDSSRCRWGARPAGCDRVTRRGHAARGRAPGRGRGGEVARVHGGCTCAFAEASPVTAPNGGPPGRPVTRDEPSRPSSGSDVLGTARAPDDGEGRGPAPKSCATRPFAEPSRSARIAVGARVRGRRAWRPWPQGARGHDRPAGRGLSRRRLL